jgi:hypothetical protein
MQRSRNFLATLLLAAVTLGGCDLVDSAKEIFKHSQAVSAELEKSLGTKSFVGFNWNNGELTSVDITFEELPRNHSLQEIVDVSRSAILSEFKEKPKQFVVAFRLTQ